MALKKSTEPTKSPALAPEAVAEPVIETPVPVDSGAAEQTPAPQPDEPAVISEADVADATITHAVISSETSARSEADSALASQIGGLSTNAEAAVAETLPEEPAVAEEADKPEFVKVENVRKTGFRQPSTEWWIRGGEVRLMANDGWLENHVNAQLLKVVED